MDCTVNLAKGEELARDAESHSPWLAVTQQMMRGDQAAFAAYYDLTFEPVFREIKRLTASDDATSLDLFQMTMIKVIKCIKPLPHEKAVVGWSIAVAKSVSYDWLRKQNRRREICCERIEEPARTESEVGARARLQWIEEQLQQLPADLQSMISFRYRWGWSLKRIAERFGLKTGSVDGRIRRAIEKLNEKAHREFDES